MLIFSTSTFAETIQLSKMDSDTRAYIQRGNPFPTVECYNAVLQTLFKRGHTEEDIWVSLDEEDAEQIGIGFDGTDEYYTCTDGELRSWEHGQYQVLEQH